MRVPGEKVVAGLSCGEVLERLSDYLDSELAPPAQAQVEGHLRGCEGCARFNGEFQSTIRSLRVELRRPGGLPAPVRDRLRRALDGER